MPHHQMCLNNTVHSLFVAPLCYFDKCSLLCSSALLIWCFAKKYDHTNALANIEHASMTIR